MVGGMIAVSVQSRQTRNFEAEGDDPNMFSDETSLALTESIAEQRAGAGIFILNTSGHLLYTDRRAWELLAEVDKNGAKTAKTLPAPVQELYREINKLLPVGFGLYFFQFCHERLRRLLLCRSGFQPKWPAVFGGLDFR